MDGFLVYQALEPADNGRHDWGFEISFRSIGGVTQSCLFFLICSANAQSPKTISIHLAGVHSGGLTRLIHCRKAADESSTPFYVLLAVGVIYYRWAGAENLRKKFIARSNR
jgi:hypothetical protein